MKTANRIFIVEEKVNGRWAPVKPSPKSVLFADTHIVPATTDEEEAIEIINCANEDVGIFRLAEYEFKREHNGKNN